MRLGFLPVLSTCLRVCSASMSNPVPNSGAAEYRKYMADGNRLLIRWLINRPLTPCAPSLLPRYITSLFLLAISYIPHSPFGILSMFSRVYLVQRFCTAIRNLPNVWYNTTCQMAAGGFEPPRLTPASGFQSHHVCHFHHAARGSRGCHPYYPRLTAVSRPEDSITIPSCQAYLVEYVCIDTDSIFCG